MKSGDTYSRTFGTTIGSESLTTVFGMGTGVAFRIWSPERSGLVGRAPQAKAPATEKSGGLGAVTTELPCVWWGLTANAAGRYTGCHRRSDPDVERMSVTKEARAYVVI